MNITISQEGSNPIKINTDDINKSVESGIPYDAQMAQQRQALIDRGNELVQRRDYIVQMMNNTTDANSRTAMQNEVNALNSQIANISNQLNPQGYTGGDANSGNEQLEKAKAYAKSMGQQYINGVRNLVTNNAIYKTNNAINNAVGQTIGAGFNNVKQGFIDKRNERLAAKAASGAANTGNGIMSNAQAVYSGIKGAGAAVVQNAGSIAAGATVAAAAVALARILGGTVFNAVASIGKFSSGKEMLTSPKFINKLSAVTSKYPGPYPTPDEVKNDPRAQNKVSFLSWLVGGGSAGKNIMSQIGSVGTLIKSINGVTVAVTSMSPINIQRLAGLKVMIATAFVHKNGQLVSVPVARAFLAKGAVVNASRECVDIYFADDGSFYKKDDIKYLAKQSAESYNAATDVESDIIDEYTL